MTEKSELAKLYTRLTGITYDLDKIMEGMSDEELIALYEKINWQISNGVVRTGGVYKELMSKFLPQLAEKCAVPADFDLDADGEISDYEQDLKDTLSSVTIVEEGSTDDGDEVTVNSATENTSDNAGTPVAI